jgi:phosphatidylglycerophosphate synthase
MVNKLPEFLECPLDIVLLRFIDTHLDVFHSLGFTPNMVTLLSIAFGCLTAYFVTLRKYSYAALLFLIAYYLDCVDGKLARKFGMQTEFGDALDHFGDLFKFTIVTYALYANNGRPLGRHQKFYKYILFIMSIFLFLQIGYQETIYNQGESPTLGLFRALVKHDSNPTETIQLTRYLGNGTFIVVFVIIMLLWD